MHEVEIKLGRFPSCTNHPISKWQNIQIEAAEELLFRITGKNGTVEDIKFPDIPAHWDEDQVLSLAEMYYQDIVNKYDPSSDIIHVMGETGFVWDLVSLLIYRGGFRVFYSTTTRRKKEKNSSGTWETKFIFVRFREFRKSKAI